MNDLKEKKKELMLTLAKISAGREKNVKKAKNIRREIARLLTKMTEDEKSSVAKAMEDKE